MVCKVQVAAFQADSLISYRYIHNKSNLIIGNDTDFAALVGKGALVIRNFKFNRDLGGHNRNRIETMKLKNIEIGGSSNKLMKDIKVSIKKIYLLLNSKKLNGKKQNIIFLKLRMRISVPK